MFQLGAAAIAVGVTAWAAFQVRPLLVEKERLEKEVNKRHAELISLKEEQETVRTESARMRRELDGLRAELRGAREATPALIEGINAFHRKDYRLAVARYNEALRLNPGDVYIYNLKSYSEYKMGDLTGAVVSMKSSLEMVPSYDWGYFDLARYQCAAGKVTDAVNTIRAAVEKRGEPVKALAPVFLDGDGEFRRLCAHGLSQMRVFVGM
ncbi:MAG TPA: hypothetical protein PKC59_09210 [Burkholderiaceae bacterium]|nr:hypothetical protein [Burkholderiaceae bacterium]HNG78870.1 hypothetical protein [Burkholderiaceae bacterium]